MENTLPESKCTKVQNGITLTLRHYWYNSPKLRVSYNLKGGPDFKEIIIKVSKDRNVSYQSPITGNLSYRLVPGAPGESVNYIYLTPDGPRKTDEMFYSFDLIIDGYETLSEFNSQNIEVRTHINSALSSTKFNFTLDTCD